MNKNYYNIEDEKTKNINTVYFNYTDFTQYESFKQVLSTTTKENKRYSLIFRVCYSSSKLDEHIKHLDYGGEWKSLGEQNALFYENIQEFGLVLHELHKAIITRIEYSMELYNKNESDIFCFQILIHNLEYTNNIKTKKPLNVKSLGDNKDLINISNSLNTIKNIPIHKKDYGTFLNKTIECNKTYLTLLDGNKIDFLEVINKHKTNKKQYLESNLEFYQNTLNNLIVVDNNNNKKIIDVYTLSGIKLYHVEDVTIPNTNKFIRKIGNLSLYIDDTGIYNKEIDVGFKSITPRKLTGLQSRMIHPDWRIGTLDIETFKDIDNYSKPYAVGFHANNKTNLFYVDNDLNFNNVLINCLDKMLTESYNRYTFYVHNLGRYDIVFILKVIIDVNEQNPDTYKYKLIFRDDLILSITITKKINNRTYTIKLVDSYNILNSSLKKLCQAFDTEVKKTMFPYSFINRYNLFYVGVKPESKFYDIDKNPEPNYLYSNKKNTLEDYNNIKKDWSTKEDTLDYLKNDLVSLYHVMEKFRNQIFIDYKTHITNNLTISGLAMDLYLRSFYELNIPLINKRSIYNDIKNSYFGGITEVYKPYGRNLYYYDVNSLYPYASLNPMPGLDCIYIESIYKDIDECVIDKDFFGFYYCEVETNDNYIGLLPVRTSTGLIMPLGYITGWYFSEELKFARENGYKIKVIKGYKFSRSLNVFNRYVEEFYKIKSTTTDPTTKAIAKSLLNNLLGRFGLKIERCLTELLDNDNYNELLQHKKVKSVKFIGDKILVTHNKEVSKEVCDAHGVDYNETLITDLKNNTNTSNFESDEYNNVSIAISSAVTAYSRIYMNKIKLDIIKAGGSIYYTDTDSIVTDIKLEPKLVGDDIGLFKLEHEIEEAYFITTKTYCLKNKQGKILIKSKGVNKDLLKIEDFKNLYNGINVKTLRNEVIRDYTNGSVNINNNSEIVLSAHAYTKRTKVYNKGLWTDTKPLTQTRNINTYQTKKRIKFNFKLFLTSVFWLLVLCFIFIITIMWYIYTFTLNTPDIEFIIRELFIHDTPINNNQNVLNINNLYNKTNTNFLEKTQFNKNYTKPDTCYIDESKILRRVLVYHLDSAINEVNKQQKTIQNLEQEVLILNYNNSMLNNCISDVNNILTNYNVKNQKP